MRRESCSVASSMATLGFHHPQFSEDAAWLPAWLLPHKAATLLDEPNEDKHMPFEQSLKHMVSLEGNGSQVKDSNLPPSKASRYNNCHLFLSGEDNSSASFTSSCEKVLRFNLRFSTSGISSYMSTPSGSICQTDKLNPANGVSMLPCQTSVGREETRQSNPDHNSVDSNRMTSPTNGETSLMNTGNAMDTTHLVGSRDDELAEIHDALELSIAASEALVINELVQCEFSSEAFPAASILEVALRVKQARVEALEPKDDVLFLKEDAGNFDLLSELDDADMEDAYRDVGLSISSPDDKFLRDSSISRVKDTPLSEDHVGQGREVQSELRRNQETYSHNISQQNGIGSSSGILKDLPIQNLDREKQKTVHSSRAIESVSRMVLQSGNTDEVSTSHAWSSGGSKPVLKEPYRFHSRWLGGWTGMEGDVSGGTKHKHTKGTRDLFVGETSYLSESADLAPDQNSMVHDNARPQKSLESSIQVEGSTNGGTPICHDVSKEPSLLYSDPLCSVVPCSLPTENASSFNVQNNNDGLVDSDMNFRVGLEHQLEKSEHMLDRNVQTVSANGYDEAVLNDANSHLVIRRHSTSLKFYSMCLPSNDASLEKKRSGCDPACPIEGNLLTSNHHIVCTDSPNERDPIKAPPEIVSKCTGTNCNVENLETSVLGNTCTTIAIQKENFGGNGKDGAEMQACQPDKEGSPIILHGMTHRRFHAPKHPIIDFSTDTKKQNVAPESSVPPCQQSTEHPQHQHEKGPDRDVPPRKRVRFSEVNLKLQHEMNLKKLPLTHKNRMTSRTWKRHERSNPQRAIGSQEVKEHLTNCRIKGRKKPIFQGLDFLITGFSHKKEKEVEGLLRKYGGVVFSDIPSPPSNPSARRSSKYSSHRLPVILCTKKLETTKFLYGCAANAFLLNISWVTDSIRAGSVLQPEIYMIFSNQANRNQSRIGKSVGRNHQDYIFDKVGILLHGSQSFCSEFSKIIKHGRGHVYKTLQWMVQSLERKKISLGVIVAEDESRATRHLRECASEQKIPMVPASWIIKSLHDGKLLPFKHSNQSPCLPNVKIPEVSVSQEWSQEI